jgi:acyl-CoA synthetase (AMP-forming)/AMP-acid ligase II
VRRDLEFTPPLATGLDVPVLEVTADDPACILYSAGSTGRPKGVVLAHRHLLAIARTLAGAVGMGPAHRDLVIGPMTHSGSWQRVTATLLAGGTVVVFEGTLSVPAVLDDLHRREITGFFTAPPLVRALLRADPGRLAAAAASLRAIEIASAPVAAAELRTLAGRLPGVDVFLQYGLTECSRALILDVRRHPDKLHTVGRPTAGVEVAVVDADGAPRPPGHEGEILLRAPDRVGRYWNLPDQGAARFRDGWFHTGDFGVVDADGFVAYRGRRDDMINCGGHSYFPAEVEVLLGALDGVKDALVAGVPDPQGLLGDVPWLFVVPHDPRGFSPAALLQHARARLPPHMRPRDVVVVPAIPTTASGKPDRRATVRRHGPQERA